MKKTAWTDAIDRKIAELNKNVEMYADIIRAEVERRLQAIDANKEALVTAWLAETGLKPSESVIVVQNTEDGGQRIWIERRKTET